MPETIIQLADIPETPELNRLGAVLDAPGTEQIAAFLRWMTSCGYTIAGRNDPSDRLIPVQLSIEEWLCEFHDIDYRRAQRERDAVYDYVSTNATKSDHGH